MAASSTRTLAVGHLVVGHGGVVVGVGDGVRLDQALGPLPIVLGLKQLGLHLVQVGLGAVVGRLRLVDLRLVQRVVDPGQHRALLDDGAPVDRLLRILRVRPRACDQAGDLGADVDDLLRLRGPRGADRRQHVAALHRRRAEVRRRIGRPGASRNRYQPPAVTTATARIANTIFIKRPSLRKEKNRTEVHIRPPEPPRADASRRRPATTFPTPPAPPRATRRTGAPARP